MGMIITKIIEAFCQLGPGEVFSYFKKVVIIKRLYERFAGWGQERCPFNQGAKYKDHTRVLPVRTRRSVPFLEVAFNRGYNYKDYMSVLNP